MAVLVTEETVNKDAEVSLQPAHPVLLEIAELMAGRPWCQGRYEDERGGVCIMGAFFELLMRNETWMEDDCWEAPYYHDLHAFERAIARDAGLPDGEMLDPAAWNDQPGRTKFEVIDRLRRVGWLGR